MTDHQYHGRVAWFDQEKGYGFIRRQSGDDVLFHTNALLNESQTLHQGQRVSFLIVQGERGRDQADKIVVLQ